MDQTDLADRFDAQRSRLRAIAYRILGSLAEADDAVQEAWLRLQRSDPAEIGNLEAWLTTVVTRIALNGIRDRRDQPLDSFRPEPVIDSADGTDPEYEALLSDGVGVAMQVVLESLSPAERVAFVLHDMFAVPFAEIAALLGRSPEATRQLASRARREVRGNAPVPDADISAQREVINAYFAAAREGDLDRLVAVLAPDVVLRAHRLNRAASELHGADRVARSARAGAGQAGRYGASARPVLVNGSVGLVAYRRDAPVSVVAFTVVSGKIAAIDMFHNPELVRDLVS
ncbi:MAG: sigma-70 family RNA polymerase sigma factor [Solirubrobacterales bacterium]|nr:sigma-70 family RNA polymerase sigma factor [Solirubrobacterales bacterium]